MYRNIDEASGKEPIHPSSRKAWVSHDVVLTFRVHAPCVVKTSDQVRDQLEFLQNKLDCCLVIDGESLQVSALVFAAHRLAEDML